jgi:hypothetical protein
MMPPITSAPAPLSAGIHPSIFLLLPPSAAAIERRQFLGNAEAFNNIISSGDKYG